MWLTALAVGFAVVAVLGRVTNLRLLAAGIASVHAMSVAMEPAYLSWLAVDSAIVFIAIACWCNASPAVAKLSIVAAVCHLSMYLMYAAVPYQAFMVAYEAYPWVIRTIEAAQLLVLLWWMPQIQSKLPAHRRGKEPQRWYGQEYSPQQ